MSRTFLLLPLLALAACQIPEAAIGVAEPTSPLDQMTRLEIPAYADTVGKAADFLLEPIGYRTVQGCSACPREAAEITAKPVSPLALRPQFTTVGRALVLVGGSRTRIVVDPRTRLVSYAWIGAAP
jgi:hypothetical protein